MQKMCMGCVFCPPFNLPSKPFGSPLTRMNQFGQAQIWFSYIYIYTVSYPQTFPNSTLGPHDVGVLSLEFLVPADAATKRKFDLWIFEKIVFFTNYQVLTTPADPTNAQVCLDHFDFDVWSQFSHENNHNWAVNPPIFKHKTSPLSPRFFASWFYHLQIPQPAADPGDDHDWGFQLRKHKRPRCNRCTRHINANVSLNFSMSRIVFETMPRST